MRDCQGEYLDRGTQIRCGNANFCLLVKSETNLKRKKKSGGEQNLGMLEDIFSSSRKENEEKKYSGSSVFAFITYLD